ncbi:MAG: hypothetical protein ACMXYE_03890 [Candidatus Woesearchaeota archaeon]
MPEYLQDPLIEGHAAEKVSAQRTYLVDKQRIKYEGLFVIQDLYKLIDEYFEEKGYDKCELKNAEVVRDDGARFIELLFEPWKKLTDYVKSRIKLRLIIEESKDVEIQKNGVKVHAHHGKILFTFDVYMETDYEKRWADGGTFSVIRVLFDKYFFKDYTKQYSAEALDDYKMLVYQIKAYLNMHKK